MEEGTLLYRRYLQGDGAALETLVAKYSDALVRFAYCLMRDMSAAEDAAEDAFVALIIKRRSFSDDTNLRAYLYRAVRNNCIDRIRKNRRTAPPLESVFDPERLFERRAENELLYAGMEELPPQYRDALYLVYIEGFRPEEAATILKRTRKQVYNLLSRARAALKEILLKKGVAHEEL